MSNIKHFTDAGFSFEIAIGILIGVQNYCPTYSLEEIKEEFHSVLIHTGVSKRRAELMVKQLLEQYASEEEYNKDWGFS